MIPNVRYCFRSWIAFLLLFQGEKALAANHTFHSQPLTVSNPSDANPREKRFQSLPAEITGLNLTHQFPEGGNLHLLQDFGASAGISTGDVDGDGLPDVFIGNYNKGGRLYRNLGGMKFEDMTIDSGIQTGGKWTTGVSFVDIENDGDLDLYVCAYRSPNMLFLNDGKGRFTEDAHGFGLDYNGASIVMSFADYDSDGFLDGYLVTHRYVDSTESKLPQTTQDTFKRGILVRGQNGYVVAPEFREFFGTINKGRGRIELLIVGQADHLYHNEEGKGFRDVSLNAGVVGNDIGLAAIWWDYNGDGKPDLYVSNDYKGADKLYANQGDGTFKNMAIDALSYMPWSSMGTAIGDVNNDGHMDLLATDMAGSTHARRNLIDDDLYRERWFYLATLPKQVRRNTLFLGTGIDRTFEAAHLAGVSQTDWTWSPKFGDFDHDGHLDLFIANGMARDFLHGDMSQTMRRVGNDKWWDYPVHRERDLVFRNMGDLRFQEIGQSWGMDSVQASFGSSVADLDRDGDLDLLITHLDAPVSLFRNDTTSGKRLLVRLQGKTSNRFGVGAKVQLVSKDQTQTRVISSNSGFMSADEPTVHFAVDDDSTDNVLRIEWPGGRVQHIQTPPLNCLLTVVESGNPSADPHEVSQPAEEHLLFEKQPMEPPLLHRRTPHDEFSIEPLLPGRLGNLGPPLAVADVNQDGLDDFFIGGTMVAAGHLMVQSTGGTFIEKNLPIMPPGLSYADRGALFIDVDSDGDEDLLVVAQNPAPTGRPDDSLNRLYLNDGKGGFEKLSAFKPEGGMTSATTVAASDFDQDGDLDLFLGNRSIPGAFGDIPLSGVFKNNGGSFTRVSDWAMKEQGRIGMVSAALWSDVNGDGWMDLLVATDWGPVRLWLNEQGRLVEATSDAGLKSITGRWNGLSAGDLDNDGDMDYLVTNTGRNEPVHGNHGEPFGVVVGVLKDTQRRVIIEYYTSGHATHPLRTRNALFAGVPELNELFPSYTSFADIQLDQLLSAIKLQDPTKFHITTSETGVLWNDGKGKFQFRPLPVETQLAPSYGSLIHDFNGDGKADILLAQNDYTRSPELGPSSAGMALLLEGNAQGGFLVTPSERTGLCVFEEMRSLVWMRLHSERGSTPGLMFGIHHGTPELFMWRRGLKQIELRLLGRPGNPRGVGSRLQVEFPSGDTRTYEIQSKTGFASQSREGILMSFDSATETSFKIRVKWPGGQVSEHFIQSADGNKFELHEPTQ